MTRTLTKDKLEPSAVPGKSVTPRMQHIMIRRQESYRARRSGDKPYARGRDASTSKFSKRAERQVMDAGLEHYEDEESGDSDDMEAMHVSVEFSEICEDLLGGTMSYDLSEAYCEGEPVGDGGLVLEVDAWTGKPPSDTPPSHLHV